MTKQTTTTKKTTKTDRHVHATSSRPSISIAFNVHDTCENEKKKQSWFCRYSIASYPLFVLPLPTRLRVEHGHALRPLCIREVRWSGRCGMGTPFELVRNLADWGFNYRSFWCCFAPCTGMSGPLGCWYQYPTVLTCSPKKQSLWNTSYNSSRARALYILVYVALSELLLL